MMIRRATDADKAVVEELWNEFEAEVPEPPGFEDREYAPSTHVQTDDRTAVDRAVAQFVPRLDASVTAEPNGWMRIAAPLLDDDRNAQRRLANELSERLGALVVALALEHGAVVRFYLYERG